MRVGKALPENELIANKSKGACRLVLTTAQAVPQTSTDSLRSVLAIFCNPNNEKMQDIPTAYIEARQC